MSIILSIHEICLGDDSLTSQNLRKRIWSTSDGNPNMELKRSPSHRGMTVRQSPPVSQDTIDLDDVLCYLLTHRKQAVATSRWFHGTLMSSIPLMRDFPLTAFRVMVKVPSTLTFFTSRLIAVIGFSASARISKSLKAVSP